MRCVPKFFFLVALFASAFLFVQPTQAAGSCFCHTDPGPPPDHDAQCYDRPVGDCVASKITGKNYTECKPLPNATAPTAAACAAAKEKWDAENSAFLKGQTTERLGGKKHWLLPDCVLEDRLPTAIDPITKQKYVTGPCGDVSVFVILLLNFGSGTFAIIGAFALAFFIYGGFTLILSQGNTEKIQKGRDIMLAAVIGLFVAFAGYAVIQFLGDAVGLKEGLGLPK